MCTRRKPDTKELFVVAVAADQACKVEEGGIADAFVYLDPS